MAGSSATPAQVKRAISRIAKKKHIKSRAIIKSAFATGFVEDRYRHRRKGSGSSVGWRQETAESYGNVDRMNLGASIGRYFNEARRAYRSGMSSGKLAQTVQRSARPGRYSQRDAQRSAGRLTRKHFKSTRGKKRSRIATADLTVGSRDGETRTETDVKGALIAAMRTSKPGSRLKTARGRIRAGLHTTEVEAEPEAPTAATPDTEATPRGSVKIDRAAADRPGVRTEQEVIRFAREVSGRAGTRVRITTGTRHSRLTKSGNVSAHWSGKAADIRASGARLTRLGQSALVAAGMSRSEARKKKGGIYNVGGRQIIFNTNDGGNHWDHLHIAV